MPGGVEIAETFVSGLLIKRRFPLFSQKREGNKGLNYDLR
jgi:hypothetical protein